MLLHSPLTKLFGSSLSRWAGAAALIGLFSVSAAGCGGCDDSSLQCDAAGKHCVLCDAYGCREADPGGNSGGSGGASANAGGGTGTGTSTGSGQSCDQTQNACPCSSNSDCDKGLACVNGLCIAGCDFSYECGAGNICINGACVPGCDAMTPCAAGYTCVNGGCVVDPKNPQCDAQDPCPAGVCVGGLCTTDCKVNADCGPGKLCDNKTHACIDDPSPQPVCSQTVKCTGVGQVCLNDGYCHYPCNSVNDCKIIDSRFIACDQNICKTQEEVQPECSLNKPCPAGKSCVSNKCL